MSRVMLLVYMNRTPKMDKLAEAEHKSTCTSSSEAEKRIVVIFLGCSRYVARVLRKNTTKGWRWATHISKDYISR